MCSTLVPGPFPFPRHGKGPRNEVDSVLFRSATSWAIYFFCLLSNAFPGFRSVGRAVGKEKKSQQIWRSLELGGLVPQYNNIRSLEMKCQDVVKLKREQRKKDDRTLTVCRVNWQCFEIMCNYPLHNFCFGDAKTWVGRTTQNGRKRGIALGDKINYATPTKENLRQTSNCSKLVPAYLPVARLTILDSLVDSVLSCAMMKPACALKKIETVL